MVTVTAKVDSKGNVLVNVRGLRRSVRVVGDLAETVDAEVRIPFEYLDRKVRSAGGNKTGRCQSKGVATRIVARRPTEG